MTKGGIERLKEAAYFVAIGCIVAVALGKDSNWDLFNYHFYNPWAWLHARSSLDVFPAQLQSFFNPLIDVPFYWAASSLRDDLVVLLLGIPFGFGLWVIWRCLGLLGGPWTSAGGRGALVTRGHQMLALAFAVTGAAGLAQVATTTGEWVVSVLVLVALWALFSLHRQQLRSTTAVALAGLSLGLATGLKLTAAIPTLAVTVALLFVVPGSWRSVLRREMLIYAGCGIAAFAVTAGPWMWFLYKNYQSPLFPFFNEVFASPLLDRADRYLDARFVPKHWWEWITAPIELSLVKSYARSELLVRDPRLLIGSVIAMGWGLSLITRWIRERRAPSPGLEGFLATVFLLSYIGWIGLFGIYRYAIVLEVMAGFMLFIVLQGTLSRGDAYTLPLAALVYGASFALTTIPSWGRTDATADRYFDVVLPRLPENAMVINATDEPVGYLVPLWPGSPRFASPVSSFADPGKLGAIQQQIMAQLRGHSGPKFTLHTERPVAPAVASVLSQLELAPDPTRCMPILRKQGGTLRVCATAPFLATNAQGFDASRRASSATLYGAYDASVDDREVWIGDAAQVVIAKTALASGDALRVDGSVPFDLYRLAEPKLKKTKVSVTVNGVRVAEQTFARGEVFSFRIPSAKVAEAAGDAPVLTVNVNSSHAVVPSAFGAGADVRRLGLQIRRVGF